MSVSRTELQSLAAGGLRAEGPDPLLTRAVVSGSVRLADIAVILGAGFLASWWRYGASGPEFPDLVQLVQLCGVLAAALVFTASLSYELESLGDPGRALGALAAAWSASIAAVLVLLYALKSGDAVSRLWIGSWWGSGLVGLTALRVAVALAIGRLQRSGRLRRAVLLVGDELGRARLTERLRCDAAEEVDVVASLPFPGAPAGDERDRKPGGLHPFARYPELAALLRSRRIDEVVLVCDGRTPGDLEPLLRWLRAFPVSASLVTEELGGRLPVAGLARLGEARLLRVVEPPLDGWKRLLKGLEDRLLGTVLLILAAPLMLVIALAVKATSPGPVFYRQLRHGFNQQPITVLKFRTMYIDRCDAPDAPVVNQATRDDPRVTPLGRLLRRTSLDELPQLINVVRGEMSLVGPRPHPVALNETYARLIDGYLARHRVKPGLTGWAQVNGCRGETRTLEEMEKRIRYDLEYIERWSILYDLRIIALTAYTVLSRRNAW